MAVQAPQEDTLRFQSTSKSVPNLRQLSKKERFDFYSELIEQRHIIFITRPPYSQGKFTQVWEDYAEYRAELKEWFTAFGKKKGLYPVYSHGIVNKRTTIIHVFNVDVFYPPHSDAQMRTFHCWQQEMASTAFTTNQQRAALANGVTLSRLQIVPKPEGPPLKPWRAVPFEYPLKTEEPTLPVYSQFNRSRRPLRRTWVDQDGPAQRQTKVTMRHDHSTRPQSRNSPGSPRPRKTSSPTKAPQRPAWPGAAHRRAYDKRRESPVPRQERRITHEVQNGLRPATQNPWGPSQAAASPAPMRPPMPPSMIRIR